MAPDDEFRPGLVLIYVGVLFVFVGGFPVLWALGNVGAVEVAEAVGFGVLSTTHPAIMFAGLAVPGALMALLGVGVNLYKRGRGGEVDA